MIKQDFPLVTVGTLCYNTGIYVIEALRCVQRQGYRNIQHIIVDDFSTDNSVELLETWINDNDYKCTFIKHEKNKGIHVGLEEIFNLSEGKYLAFISDDLWSDDKLIEQVKFISSFKGKVGMVYGDIIEINEQGDSISSPRFKNDFNPPSGTIFKDIAKDFFFYIQASLIDLELFKKLNYKLDDSIISEDWDWQLIIARHYEIYGQKKMYAKYRKLGTSITASNWNKDKMDKVNKSHFVMIEKYYNHPLNTKEDNLVILSKLRSILLSSCKLTNFKYTDRIIYSFKILKKSYSFVDIKTFFKMFLSNKFFKDSRQQSKNLAALFL